jgi:ethanolamine utilization protein EutN
MQIGQVVGHAVATVKHPSLSSWRLLLVQLLTADAKPDGEPLLAIDSLGAGVGSRVILSNDGASARALVKAKNSPARWMTVGISDA